MHNYFGQFFDFLARSLRQWPFVSTWFAALFLSFIWTFSWLTVFFATTWFFALKTNATDLINVFWLSVAAEAIMRWAENSNFVAAVAKPFEREPKGDNQDFRVTRAMLLFLSSLVGMFFFDFFLERIGMKDGSYFFDGQGSKNGYAYVSAMLVKWWHTISETGIAAPLLIGTFFRAVIYKRSHAPSSSRANGEKHD